MREVYNIIMKTVFFFATRINHRLFNVANEFLFNHRRHGKRTSLVGWWRMGAQRITEVTEGDSAIINMPSAGSHKSRVIEFSTSITGRRATSGNRTERDISWTGVRWFHSAFERCGPLASFCLHSLLPSIAIDRMAIDSTTFVVGDYF